jgi:YgiT-type zinc finger domain-containing protein
MKCVICYSPSIEQRTVNEEIWVNEDVVLISLSVLVCNNCGERYYNREAMRRLEEAEKALRENRLSVKTTGRVLQVVT